MKTLTIKFVAKTEEDLNDLMDHIISDTNSIFIDTDISESSIEEIDTYHKLITEIQKKV